MEQCILPACRNRSILPGYTIDLPDTHPFPMPEHTGVDVHAQHHALLFPGARGLWHASGTTFAEREHGCIL